MNRGEIWPVDFEPSTGAEVNKQTRPAIIVSNNALNRTVKRLNYGVVTVIPLSSRIDRTLSHQVYLSSSETGLKHDSKTLTEQVRAVDISRVLGKKPWGSLIEPLLREVELSLLKHFALIGR